MPRCRLPVAGSPGAGRKVIHGCWAPWQAFQAPADKHSCLMSLKFLGSLSSSFYSTRLTRARIRGAAGVFFIEAKRVCVLFASNKKTSSPYPFCKVCHYCNSLFARCYSVGVGEESLAATSHRGETLTIVGPAVLASCMVDGSCV